MRALVGAGLGLTLACAPAVSVDAGAGANGMTSTDGDLPPLTSGWPTSDGPSTGDSEAGDTPMEILDIVGAEGPGIPPDDPCNEGWDVLPLRPAVMLVVDVSGSMTAQVIDHDADPRTPPTTRWFALWEAMTQELPSWDATHDLGLRTFPSPLATDFPDPFACDFDGVTVVPAAGTSGDILDALPAPDATLAGAAPARLAINEALTLLYTDLGRQRVVVVITDGAPNCAPEDVPPASFDEVDIQVVDDIYMASLTGTSTAVIALDVPDVLHPGGDGEPATNALAALDGMASAGGLFPAALNATSVNELQAHLLAIRATTPSDRLRIPDPSYGFYYVEIGGITYTEVDDCSDGDGFVLVYGGQYFDTLRLCGQAASALQQNGEARIWPECVFAE